jgi:hypothetical protein
MHVYCVTTSAQAERIATEGFEDADHGTRCRGVLVHVAPVCVTAPGLAVIDILVGDEHVAPYVDGAVACVPARLLNAGCVEVINI